MLCIENIRFWCKVQGFLDRINTPETVLRIIIDENIPLPHLPGTTKQNTTEWQEHPVPPIQLSPYQETYKIEFGLYREGQLIGMGRTEFKFKQSRKDALDIVDREFKVTGKLVYELNWIKDSKPGSYITYEQVLNVKTNSAGKEFTIAPQIKTEKEKKIVKKEEDECSTGICACFAVRKKKTEPPRQIQEPPVQTRRVQQPRLQFEAMPEPKKEESIKQSQTAKFINNPYVYFEEQLQAGRPNDVQQLNRLCFYSKKIVISK